MPLPASGAISMSQLRTEFGGTAPDSLSEYYRGGGLVPDVPDNAAVPTSGTIKLTDFYNATARTFGLTDIATPQTDFALSGTAEVTITLESDGDILLDKSVGGATDIGAWTLPVTVGIGSSYEARLTVNSGDAPSAGTTGTWLGLSGGRVWSWLQSTTGILSGNYTLEIRPTSGSVVASRTFDVEVERG